MGRAYRLIILLLTIVLVQLAASQPIDQRQHRRQLLETVDESPLVYYPFKAFTEVAKDVRDDPQIRYPIPGFFPVRSNC